MNTSEFSPESLNPLLEEVAQQIGQSLGTEAEQDYRVRWNKTFR